MVRFALALSIVLAPLAVACGDNTHLDPCVTMECPVQMAPHCDGDVVVTQQAPTCTSPDGVTPVCDYGETRTDCTAQGMVCGAGACHPPGDPCAGVTCATPPADDCTDKVAHHYPATGTCDGSSGSATCTYAPTDTDCSTSNQTCAAGACVDPCGTTTCTTPPPNTCASGVYTSYPATGTCTSPNGNPSCSYAPTTTDCAASNQACDPASGCVDPCIGFTCTTPPAATCASGVLTTYAASGTCSSPGGVPQCDYAPTTTDCAAQNQACDAGAAACVDPCAGMTCATPPPATCSPNGILTTYAATGTCTSPGGVAQCDYAFSNTDCPAQNKTCDAAAGQCDDPCVGFACTTPPPSTCAGNTLTTYADPGTCSSPGGVPGCTYAPATLDCTTVGDVCANGACVPPADPCAGVTCDTPPASSCGVDGFTLTTYDATGTCSSSTGSAVCSYGSHATDCAATDRACSGGACVDPCVGFACTSPPSSTCNGKTLTTYANPGTCSSPGGVPACAYAPAATDCGATNQTCTGGACADPCVGVTCTTPPGPTCTGTGNNTARTFGATGTCSSPGGDPQCDYPTTDTDCSLSGQTCTTGACTGPVLFCRVQFPDTIVDVPTTTQTVYGRIYVQGVTDQTGGYDANPNVVVQLGLGAGTDPTAYAYTPAMPNLSYGPGSPGYEANNDEYDGTFIVPNAPGTVQHYAYRLSNDAGATWLYCDTGNAGSSDGFTQPGTLDIAAPYFSEYVESTVTADKAIAVYNPGSIPFSMTGCLIQLYSNGSSTPTNTGVAVASLTAGGVYTLCKTGITDATHCDQTTGSGLWNGNDAIALKCGTTVYDVFGQIGNDPGAGGWGTGGTTTTDHTLLRQCNVFAGDTNGTDAFDPATQWAAYPNDTLTYLGARNCPLP